MFHFPCGPLSLALQHEQGLPHIDLAPRGLTNRPRCRLELQQPLDVTRLSFKDCAPCLGRQNGLIAGISSENLLCSLQGHGLRLPAIRSGSGGVHKVVLCACCWGCLCCRHAPLHAWQQPLRQIVRPIVLPWPLLRVPAKDYSHCAVPCWCNGSHPGSLGKDADCS